MQVLNGCDLITFHMLYSILHSYLIRLLINISMRIMYPKGNIVYVFYVVLFNCVDRGRMGRMAQPAFSGRSQVFQRTLK